MLRSLCIGGFGGKKPAFFPLNDFLTQILKGLFSERSFSESCPGKYEHWRLVPVRINIPIAVTTAVMQIHVYPALGERKSFL